MNEADASTKYVSVLAGENRIRVVAQRLDGVGDADESEVAARRPAIEDVIVSITFVADQISQSLRATDADRVTVEFGCDFGWETGTLVAVFGKAAAHSALKVGLEWNRSPAR